MLSVENNRCSESRALKRRSIRATDFFICCATAAMLSLQLYRPIFSEINDNSLLKLVYVAGFLCAILAFPRVLKARVSAQDFLLLAFLFFLITVSLVGSGVISLDHFMLLGFLCVSYILGKWSMLQGRTLLVLLMVAVTYFAISAYVVYQLFIYDFNYHYYLHYSTAKLRVGYLTIGLYGVLAVVAIWKSGIPQFGKLSMCGVASLVVFISGARMSIIILSLLITYVVCAAFVNRSLRKGVFFGAPLLLIGIVVILYKYGLGKVYEMFAYTFLRMTSLVSGEDKSVEGRDSLISLSIDKFLDSPIVGHGVGSVERLFLGSYPHNMLLEALVEGGIFSGLLLLVFLMVSLRKAYSSRQVGYAYLGFLAVYFVVSYLKSFSFYDGRILFFILGCLSVIPFKKKWRRS